MIWWRNENDEINDIINDNNEMIIDNNDGNDNDNVMIVIIMAYEKINNEVNENEEM